MYEENRQLEEQLASCKVFIKQTQKEMHGQKKRLSQYHSTHSPLDMPVYKE